MKSKKSMEENISAVKTEIYHELAKLQGNIPSEFTSTYNYNQLNDFRIVKKHQIITGVPKLIEENVFKYIEDICETIGYAFSASKSIFLLTCDYETSPIISFSLTTQS